MFSIFAPPHSRKLTILVWNHSLSLLALRVFEVKLGERDTCNICWHHDESLPHTACIFWASQDFAAPVYKAVLHSSTPFKICSYSWIWVANFPGMGKKSLVPEIYCKSGANLFQLPHELSVYQKRVLTSLLRSDSENKKISEKRENSLLKFNSVKQLNT